MTTEAVDIAAAPQQGWRLDTANGSMAPRSALDVLVDLNGDALTDITINFKGLTAASQLATSDFMFS